jgi:hypothetical protein
MRDNSRSVGATCRMESLDLPAPGAASSPAHRNGPAEHIADRATMSGPFVESAAEDAHVTEWKLSEAMAGYGVIEGPESHVVMITTARSSLLHKLQPLATEMLRLERSGVRVVERDLPGVDMALDGDSALVLWGYKELRALEAAGVGGAMQRDCLIDLVCVTPIF